MQIVTNKNNPVGARLDDWQKQLKFAIRDVSTLFNRLDLGIPDQFTIEAANDFGVFVPGSLLSRIKPGDQNDPILKQVLPLGKEVGKPDRRFTQDPVGDLESSLQPGLIHKYPGRVLLICASACPVHCRYCFRRHYPYEDRPHGRAEFENAANLISSLDGVSEIILSGGDPLMMVDQELDWLVARFAEIPNIKRIRIHSRFPSMIPCRVTDGLIRTLTNTRLSTTVVLHVNHANEINSEVENAVRKLQQSGCNILNQSVLLRGINDCVETLVDLCESLINMNVLPYYLNQLDRVVGSQHFEVPVEVGRRLVRQMRDFLPGYAVPRYVQDVPGHKSKHVLA